MPKSRSHKRHHKHKRTNRGLFKKITRTTGRAIPAVASGLRRVGSNVKNITMKSRPVVEKGLGSLYSGVLTGFDLGVKGIKKGIHVIKSKTLSRSRRHR
jgi:hypothetical protein